MPVTVYRSSDPGAPIMNGAAGRLIAVLDWALVAGAGWVKTFAGTNVATYRAPGGLRHTLRVDDTATTSASLRAYESMTAVDTGVNPYPNLTQVAASGIVLPKSSVGNADGRAFAIYASERGFYMFIRHTSTTIGVNGYSHGMFFGDLGVSYKPGDAYHSLLLAGDSTSAWKRFTNTFASGADHFVARSHDQVTVSVPATKGYKMAGPVATQSGADSGAATYPDPVTGGIKLAPIEMIEPVVANTTSRYTERGRMPGLFAPLHEAFGVQHDTFAGSGVLTGKGFELVVTDSGSRLVLQTAGDWY